MHKKNTPQVKVDPIYSFKIYNDFPGKIETDISQFTEKRQVYGKAVISPDKSKIGFIAEYFYPNQHQASSRIFVNHLLSNDTSFYSDQQIGKIIDSNAYKRNPPIAAEIGFDGQQREYFKAFSIVDWSVGSDKLLFKETDGEFLRGIWSTSIWVFDCNTGTSRNLEEARKAVLYFWKTYKKLDLSELRWDITPLGWDKNNHDQIIFKAYGYNNDGKTFLGLWTINANAERTKLISLEEKDIEIGQYGIELLKTEPLILTKKVKKRKKIISFSPIFSVLKIGYPLYKIISPMF
ncbi:MAG: hypothetical protein WCK67_00020 [bacterium]